MPCIRVEYPSKTVEGENFTIKIGNLKKGKINVLGLMKDL